MVFYPILIKVNNKKNNNNYINYFNNKVNEILIINLANCCNPIPGNPIIAHINLKKTIVNTS